MLVLAVSMCDNIGWLGYQFKWKGFGMDQNIYEYNLDFLIVLVFRVGQ